MNRRVPIFVGIGAVVLILLVLLVLVMPKVNEVGAAEDQLVAAQNEEQRLTAQVLQLQELAASAPQFQRQLDEAERLMPATVDKQGLIRSLQLVATNAGVDFAILSISNPTLSATGDFSTIGLTITVSGDFFQVAQYLFDLEHLKDRAIKVTGVQMSPSGWPELSVSLGAEAYTTDTLAGPGSQPGPQGVGGAGAATP